MAPKGRVKATSRESRQTPVLSMLLDSPGPSRLNFASKSSASLGSRTRFSSSAEYQPSSALRNELQSSFSTMKGESRDTTHNLDLLWCDRFAPRQKADLGIHKKKVELVENWLREALDGNSFLKKYRRVLVLSGPAGSGKSTLIRILSQADQLDFQVTEWRNDDGQMGLSSDHYWDRGSASQDGYNFDSFNRAPLPSKLNMFLSSASRYSTLAMQEDGEESPIVISKAPSRPSSRRIILLEDLPNLSHSAIRLSFIATLEAFLEQNEDSSTPLVLIVSESTPRLDDWGTEESTRDFNDRNKETLSVKSMIPYQLRNNDGFINIEFNVVAKTILAKALKRVLELARPLQLQFIPAPSIAAKEILEAVIESAEGDIRSAVNTLQVVCTTKAPNLETRGTKRKANGNSIDKASKRAIASISAKEPSLVIFHTLGRILYNKRVGDPTDKDDSQDEGENGITSQEKADDLPLHWQPFLRRKSRVDAEMVWRTMPVDSSSLQAYLHNNYAPFCDNIEQCSALCDNLSYAESVRPSHEGIFHGPLIDYYNFLITIHGTLVSLPSPVSRDKIRPLKSPALFYKQKQLRENLEKLDDLRIALQEESKQGTTSLTMSEAGMMRLLCELLPIISKTHPNMISSSVMELVDLPWSSSRVHDQEKEEEAEMDESLTEVADASQSPRKRVLNPLLLPLSNKVESFIDEDDDIEEF